MKYLIVSEKPWHRHFPQTLSAQLNEEFILVTDPKDLTLDRIEALNPGFIFFPHWSHLIPADIYERYNCIVFHMTDLPYGRGGSPLQNLIVRGHKTTMLSALKATRELDAGDIYLKRPLMLSGTAEQIFINAADIMIEMIIEIIKNKISPVPQKGEVVKFRRRTKEEGNLDAATSIGQVYDMIRMLDCPGYPNAFIENEHFIFEFSKAEQQDKSITAHVRIHKK